MLLGEGDLFTRLAFYTARKLCGVHQTPPHKGSPADLWDAFFLFACLVINTALLAIALPGLMLLSLYHFYFGWGDCSAIVLTSLSGAQVAITVFSMLLSGPASWNVAAQLVLVVVVVGARFAAVVIGGSVVTASFDDFKHCPTALLSLLGGMLPLLEVLPVPMVWIALLSVRWHRDAPDLPLVNLHGMLPPERIEKYVMPRRLWRENLYHDACESDARAGLASVGVANLNVNQCTTSGVTSQSAVSAAL